MFQAKAFAKLWWLSLPAFLVATAFATAAQTQTTPGKDRSRIHRARGVSNLPSNRGRGRLGHRRSKLPRRRARAVHRATLSPISRHRGHLPLARQYHVELRDLVVKHEPGGLAVELRLSGPVTPRLSTLHTPARVVVDLPKTMLAASVRSIEVSGDGVKTVRASRGGHVPSTTRVVVDLARPLNYEIVPGGNNNWILKLHPVSTDNAGSMELADQHNEAIHPATETSVLPSASAPPSDGQSAPTVPKPAAASITGNVGNPSGAVNPAAVLPRVESTSGPPRNPVSDFSAQEPPTISKAAPVELRDLVVKHEPGGLAVELRLSGPVTPRLSTLHTPARVVVDLPKTMLAASVRSIEVSGDGVKTVRASRGGHVPSTTRVVVDLARPLNYEIVPGGNNNWILKLHPVSTDNAGFVEAADQHRKEGIHRATEVPGSPTPSAQPTVSTSNSGSIQISDQRKEATHTAAEGPVLPSASAQPANGQPAPTASANRAASKVTGVVKDQTGAVIPDAELTLVERATGESRHTVSDNSGNFVFKDMPPGHYLLRGKAESMQSAEREVIVDRNAVEVTLMMRVSAEDEVTVSATAEPLSPDNNPDAVDLHTGLLTDLPTDTQNLMPLLSKFVSPAAGGTEGVSLVVDGMEAGQIDDLPASAIKQVAINRNPYGVEFRRPGKARVEVTTKHGSQKRYRGGLGIFARDSVFDAKNAFSTYKPNLSRRLYEGTFSGPLGLRGSSFFISTQHLGDTESAIVNATLLNASNQPVSVVQNVPTGLHRNDYMARLDFHPSQVHTLTGSYSFDEKFESNHGVGGLDLAERAIPTALRGHKFQVTEQAVLSPTLFNTARLLVRRSSSLAGNPPSGYAIDVNGNFSSGPSQTSLRERQTQVEFEDTAVYARKNQTFRIGGGTRTRLFHVTDESNFGGTFRFSDLTHWSQGQPYVFSMNQGQPDLAYTIHEANGFVQDEVRVHSTLSLIAGLRYDWQSTIASHKSLAPRLALAYSPGNRKTIFRAGAGLFYEYLPHSATEQALLLDGTHLQQVVISDPSYPNPFAAGTARPPSVVRIAPGLTTPYLAQASVSVERELGPRNQLIAEYQTLRGVHLFRSRNINAPLPLTGVQPDPNFFNINQVESTASLRSNALSLSYRGAVGRLFHGIVQYTFSKTSNDTSGAFSLPADNYDLRSEWGRADFDQRHRLNLAGTVNLPGAFRVGTVFSVASGVPFDITTGYDNNHDSAANDRPAGVTRNTGNGPGLLQLDFRVTKFFRVWRPLNRDRNSQNLEIDVDAFNVINHTNYPNFLGVMTSPLFGRPDTALPARTMQTSLHYHF